MSNGGRLLLVEDDVVERECLAALLRNRGFVVTPAADGEAAIHALSSERFDVILCDIDLPGFSGVELLSDFARLAPQASVILMSGHAPVDLALEGVASGAVSFITKPFEADDACWLIRRALRGGSGGMSGGEGFVAEQRTEVTDRLVPAN